MMVRVGQIAFVLAVAGSVAGCGSARLGELGPSGSRARPAPVQANEPPPVEAVPSGSVFSEPLAPPPGSGAGAVVADVPSMPSVPAEPAAPRSSPSVAPSAGAGRSAAVGSYRVRDASGANCRISLSSSPSLDLYKASSSGCTNKDLGRVTAWDYREGEVYLYQPGGAVAARLRGAGGELTGVMAKSGAPLTLSR